MVDYAAKQHISFCEHLRVVAELSRHALTEGNSLRHLGPNEHLRVLPLVGEDVYNVGAESSTATGGVARAPHANRMETHGECQQSLSG